MVEMNMNMTHETSMGHPHESDQIDPSLSDIVVKDHTSRRFHPFFEKIPFTVPEMKDVWHFIWNHWREFWKLISNVQTHVNTMKCDSDDSEFIDAESKTLCPHSSTDDEFLFKTKQVTIIIIIVIIVSTLWQSSIAMEAFEDVFHIKHGHIPLLC